MKLGKFRVFVVFGVNLKHFHFKKKQINSPEKPTGKHILSIMALFNVPNHKEWKKVHNGKKWKKYIKALKMGNFWGFFVKFGVNLRHFHLDNCYKLFRKDYWTPHSFLVDPLKHSNSPSLSKIWQNMHKIFEKWKCLGFLSFSVQIEELFHCKEQSSLQKSLLDYKLVPC